MLLNFSNYLIKNSESINVDKTKTKLDFSKEILTKTNSDEDNNLNSRRIVNANKYEQQ